MAKPRRKASRVAEVYSLFGDPIPPAGVPNPQLVMRLEQLLDRARAGEVVGIVYACLHGDRSASWAATTPTIGYPIIGALDCAKDWARMSIMGSFE